MFSDLVFNRVLDELSGEISGLAPISIEPLPVDSWVARSVMQKAIRRGMTDLALKAAHQLLLLDKRALWRRLLITAMEDLGPGELATTSRIVAAMRSAEWRARVGGDWAVIAVLVIRACLGTRCQSANELWNIGLHCPTLARFKSDLCEASMADVMAVISDPGQPTDHRAVAMLLATGDCCPECPDHLQPDPYGAFEAVSSTVKDDQVAVICREAYRLTRVPLALLLMAPIRTRELQLIASRDDSMPEARWVNGIPTFGLDQYTRAGRAAISAYAASSDEWRTFARGLGLDRRLSTAAAGELLFRVEGAACSRRRVWALGLGLHERSSNLGCFIPPASVPVGEALIVRQLPHIDIHRAAYLTHL